DRNVTGVQTCALPIYIEQEEWLATPLPEHLCFHYRIVADGEVLAQGRDLAALKERFAGKAVQAIHHHAPKQKVLSGTTWVFASLDRKSTRLNSSHVSI